MIAELRGKVLRGGETSLVVLIQGTGLGLEITVPGRSIVEPGADVALHTYMHIGSDGAMLCGFETIDELQVFQHLLAVNGVGPRMAVRVLSTHPVGRIVEALDQEDPTLFRAVSGIGAKLASRIILELRGKLVVEDGAGATTPTGDGVTEALDALLSLGYSRTEAGLALNQTAGDDLSVEQRIAAALRDLSGGVHA